MNEIMTNVPPGGTVYKWMNAGQRWQVASCDEAFRAWVPANFTLNPGEGAYFFNPGPPFDPQFCGQRPVPILPVDLAPGWNLVSHQIPEPGTHETVIGTTPVDGTSAARWNPLRQAHSLFIYLEGVGWLDESFNPVDLTFPLGEPLFILATPGGPVSVASPPGIAEPPPRRRRWRMRWRAGAGHGPGKGPVPFNSADRFRKKRRRFRPLRSSKHAMKTRMHPHREVESAPPSLLTRRQFMSGLAIAGAAFQVVPGSVLGLNGATSPNEKLNLGGVGVGGQGGGDLANLESENIIALCDVDWAHAAGTFKKYASAKRFKDYRQMLEEVKDLDAVVVATPDHVHAFASMAALRLGKHVYCEKPLTHSVWEARQVAQLAREKKVTTQMGNQGQGSEETRRLCELVWSGVIGPVREAHIWTDRPSQGLFREYWPQGVERPKDTPKVPETLAWDLWVGPAPARPYHPTYLPFKWRGWWDFGTGALGDIGCHAFDPVFRALKLGAPISVQASSSRVNEETYPLASMVTYQFPARSADVQANNYHVQGQQGAGAGGVEMPPLKLVWYDGGLRPPRPESLPEGASMGDNGRLLVGDNGFILVDSVFPKSLREAAANVPRTISRSVGHYREWVEACKQGKHSGGDFDWAGPLAEAVLLGNVALRVQLRQELTGKALLWDPAACTISNSTKANDFLRREYRPGWTL